MADEIYLRRKGSPDRLEGPMSQEDFLDQIDRREIQFGDFAWRAGAPDWVLVGSLALFLRRRNRPAADAPGAPPSLALRTPSATARNEAALRDLLLRMDRMQVFAGVPVECTEIVSPLHLVLCANPVYPGGKAWRRLATELTSLFAARVRFEQAALLPAHPSRVLLGDKGFADAEACEESMALLAAEELKRRAVLLGADLLVQFNLRFEFIVDSHAHRQAVSTPVVVASALAGLTAEAAAARRTGARLSDPATSPAATTAEAASDSGASKELLLELQRQQAELEERRRSLEEREAYLTDAEARVMAKMEEQQVREAELEQRADVIQRQLVQAGLARETVEPREKA